jgi:hypothetical protein
LDFLQAALANVLSLVAFGCVIAGVMKCFQIANELGEIKTILKEMRRMSETPAAGVTMAHTNASSAQSPQALIRALDADSYAEAIHRELAVQPPPVSAPPALQPEVLAAARSDSANGGVHGA